MKSIFSKMGLAITSLVLIILILIWIFQIAFLNRFYIYERKNSLLAEGKKIASMVEASKDKQNISTEIESFSSSFDSKIYVIDAKGNIIISNDNITSLKRSDKRSEFSRTFIEYLDITKLLQGKVLVEKTDRNQRHKISLLIVGVPIESGNNIIGGVILITPLAPVYETISILKKQLSIISIISLLIAAVLSFLLAKLFTKPILKITETAKEIAKGDFNASVHLDSKDEIGMLGKTINALAEQLGQIEKFRKEFIANISHELKTPLSLIRAYAELIIDMPDYDPNERNNNLKIIVEETDKLNKMVNDILYLSEMESGYLKLKLTNIPLIEIVQDVIKKLSFLAKKRNIELILRYDNKNTLIYADEDKIERVFFNIINNALIHSFENGQVVVSVYNHKNTVHIEIRDYGEGIPEEDLPYIWDRFYKVDKSRKRNSDSGTGLGMAIVKNILESHHFKYGIKSKLNEGTLVWIDIPNKRPDY